MWIATLSHVHKAPLGRHNAAPGLYLIVTPRGRRWAFRYTKPSTRRVTELGLGSATLITLAEAREKALDYRRAVAKGLYPVEQKREQRRSQITFNEIANAYLAIKQQEWRGERAHQKTSLLLDTYASPLATKSVNTITPDDVEAALHPLWHRSRTQGRRTQAVIYQVFELAIAKGYRTANNPADWRIVKRRFPKVEPVRHLTAMDYMQVPAFVKRLRSAQERRIALSPFAIEFLILAACRTSEVTRMRWEEIDWEQGTWTVPASRTKVAREHRVPLADRALVLLKQQFQFGKGDYVGRGRKSKPIDDRVLYRYLVRSMKVPVTIHGFRSSFRDWAGNETNFDRVTCELALAHKAGDATELAYRRGDALAKRRALMAAWADYCGSFCD
jgi:integrase